MIWDNSWQNWSSYIKFALCLSPLVSRPPNLPWISEHRLHFVSEIWRCQLSADWSVPFMIAPMGWDGVLNDSSHTPACIGANTPTLEFCVFHHKFPSSECGEFSTGQRPENGLILPWKAPKHKVWFAPRVCNLWHSAGLMWVASLQTVVRTASGAPIELSRMGFVAGILIWKQQGQFMWGSATKWLHPDVRNSCIS